MNNAVKFASFVLEDLPVIFTLGLFSIILDEYLEHFFKFTRKTLGYNPNSVVFIALEIIIQLLFIRFLGSSVVDKLFKGRTKPVYGFVVFFLSVNIKNKFTKIRMHFKSS